MADTVTRTEHIGCFGKLMESIKNLVGAVILVLIAVAVIFGNEYVTERQADNLAAGAASVVEGVADTVNPALEGKLVHLSGMATTTEQLTDQQFGISVNALKLTRTVEMYQYKETANTTTTKNVGGSEERTTTYSYPMEWSSTLISSASFQDRTKVNPSSMPYQTQNFVARQAVLGAFTLPESILQSLSATTGLTTLPAPAIPGARLNGSGYYIGANPGPQVGDVRITFAQVAPQVISICARQTGSTFTPFSTESGTIEMVVAGTQTAAQMFESAQSGNKMLRWGLRFLGWLLLFAGIAIVFQPLVVIADVIPLVGNLLQRGVTLISLLISVPAAIILMIVAWFIAKMLA